jgi:hypothetical protein
VGTAHRAHHVWRTAVATQRCQQAGAPGLRLPPERHPDVVEVRARRATLARGAGHHLGLGLLGAVVAPIAMHARRVAGRSGWTPAQTRRGAHRQATVACGHPIAIEGLQGAPERLIVALCGGHAGRHEAVGGLLMEASGDEGARLSDTPQAIAPPRFDGFPRGEVAPCRVLAGGLVDDLAHATCVEHACDQAEVSQDLATVRGWVGHHHLLCW